MLQVDLFLTSNSLVLCNFPTPNLERPLRTALPYLFQRHEIARVAYVFKITVFAPVPTCLRTSAIRLSKSLYFASRTKVMYHMRSTTAVKIVKVAFFSCGRVRGINLKALFAFCADIGCKFTREDTSNSVMYLMSCSRTLSPAYNVYSCMMSERLNPMSFRIMATQQPVRCLP